MVSLKEKVQAEKENISKVLWYLQRAISRKGKTELSLIEELAPIATFLYEAYNGIENILKLTLTAKGIKIPSSEKWHIELLELAESNNII